MTNRIPKTLSAAVVGLAISMAIAFPAQAVVITWTGSTLTGDGTADISNTGSLVEAHNNGSGATAITAGGVLFDATETDFFGGGNASAFNPVLTTGDANFDAILSTGSFVNGASAQSYTVDGLIDGHSYLAQFFVLDSRGSGTGGSGLVSITMSDDMSGTITSSRLFDGYAFTGTFVAVGTTQVVSVMGNQNTNSSQAFALMNAWQLRDTTATAPEPATLALMGLGLAGIGYRRQRIKKAA